MDSPPLICVGMPVYNGEKYIEESILSVLNQTLEDFELIVSDNASTDNTEEICRDIAQKDNRVKYFRNRENIGAAPNYNILFHKSKSTFFRWHNADDLIAENHHERCLEVLKSNPDAVLCYGKTRMIDRNGHFLNDYHDNLHLTSDSPVDRFREFFNVIGLTNVIYGLIRSASLSKTMLMGDGSFPAADTNLIGELALHGKMVEIPETLFFRRMHEDASSWDQKTADVQKKFWTGRAKNFILPVWKKQFAYFRAIRNAPVKGLEKRALNRYMFRRMIWDREGLLEDMIHLIPGLIRRQQS